MNYSSPHFDTLPASSEPGLRWVGSALMDEEQYRIEKWERREVAETVYWRCSRWGCVEYGQLRKARRDDRKAQWQARQEDDPAHQQWLDGLVDGAA